MIVAAEKSPALSAEPGEAIYVTGEERDPVTVLGTFWPGKNSIAEVLAAAKAVERLGYLPEIRFSGNGSDPESLELVTKDVPALIGKLRASLPSTSTKEARNAETTKPFTSHTRQAPELHQ